MVLLQSLKRRQTLPNFPVAYAAWNRFSISFHGEKSKSKISLRCSLYRAETISMPLIVIAAVQVN